MMALLSRMQELVLNPVSILLLTLGAFVVGEKLFIRSGRKGWLHPVLIGSVLVIWAFVLRHWILTFTANTVLF